jgi:hypothetical protein
MLSPERGSFGSAARAPEDAAMARREAPHLREKVCTKDQVAPFGAPSPRL